MATTESASPTLHVGEPSEQTTPAEPGLKVAHLDRASRAAAGERARDRTPLDRLADFDPSGRPDPVALLEGQAASRVPELVPIRYGRMLASPFAFYRGAALPMAADLARTATSGLQVQLCGDAHMSNFGVYASPERRLVFDVNDFDETYPGPFEWDVKRLAGSLAVAGRENGFSRKKRRRVALAAGAGYREAMTTLAAQGNLAVWYTHVDTSDILDQIGKQLDASRQARTAAMLEKARGRDNLQALSKLTRQVDGHPKIVSQPPLIVPVEELWGAEQTETTYTTIRHLVRQYRRTLQHDRRHLLEEFELVQVARKVVGVGSVGTRAYVLLFEGIDGGDPLFLQAKEAQASVLSGFVKARTFKSEGERVVCGQQLMQSSSDIFLGWQRALGPDGVERDFYLRQLRDGKGSVVVEQMVPDGMAYYAHLCGGTLARAHARSGDRVAIAAYLGTDDRFDQAVADFAELYADQNDLDHAALRAAADAGRIEVVHGL